MSYSLEDHFIRRMREYLKAFDDKAPEEEISEAYERAAAALGALSWWRRKVWGWRFGKIARDCARLEASILARKKAAAA